MLTVEFDLLELRPGDAVLDLGCGAGRHTYAALERGAHVVAVDLDADLLADVAAMCAGMYEEGLVPEGTTASFVHADATRLPFDDGAFDRVIVSEVLEHIPDDGAAMKEVARVLKPHGTAAVTVPRWWPERVCWALSDEYHANEGGHVRIYRTRELDERLARHGLRPLRSHHAHALHAPYWWLKCASGVRDEEAPLPKLYHRMLVWQLERRSRALDAIERTLNPLLGKSLVVYADKADA
ncbi:MAG TPA: class I SAM-dependent methyltransferase [Actinomycetota bacterium]|nr:class I SAM-dependent methyltransferase [Actinomycetota bacterium]